MLHSLAMPFQDASSQAMVVLRQGVGERIAARSVPKIFLLNGSHDRETSASSSRGGPMSAADSVSAVCDALNRRYTKACTPLVRLRMVSPRLSHCTRYGLPPGTGETHKVHGRWAPVCTHAAHVRAAAVPGSRRRLRSGACHPFHAPNVVAISSVKPALTCAKRCARLGCLLTGVDSLLLAHLPHS
jgi:hypothetical protein